MPELPPPLELECLKSLWRLEQASVHDVRDDIAAGGRELAYTTVMTLLDRLARRGAASRIRSGRAFLYRPVLTRDEARTLALEELVATHFGGSHDALRAYLAGAEPEPPIPSSENLDITLL
ncbi:MAG: BlaI/MecI/CopY family transcriptional regulator [Acidimicrobiia bacterium]|nr:BlaI/MecI/CopY family transcriptional regulator [Acidimicrobiia bacterium]